MEYKTGIYKIKNLINGRFYIGGTVKNFQSRWVEHKTTLNRGKHRNRLLQEDWIIHGEQSFEFVVMERLPIEDVLCKEQEILMIFFDGGKTCYNLANRAIKGGGRKHIHQYSVGHDNPVSVKNRQTKRRAALNEIARAAGFSSWTAYETAVIHSNQSG